MRGVDLNHQPINGISVLVRFSIWWKNLGSELDHSLRACQRTLAIEEALLYGFDRNGHKRCTNRVFVSKSRKRNRDALGRGKIASESFAAPIGARLKSGGRL